MKVQLLGVRGSTPAPGADFVRYGGHTSCVAITAEGGDRPTLVLDAGTGLRSLTALLDGAAFDGSIVLSHLHWDHMQGLPFFAAGDRDAARVDLYVPAQDDRSGRDLLAQSFAPPSFPITPEGLHGSWEFHALEPGTHKIQGMTVTAVEIEHKGGRTFRLRVEDEHGSLAYLPDHAPATATPAERDRAVALSRDVDVLLHGAPFDEPERATADAFGHATVDDAIAIAADAGVGHLVLVHHGPDRTDHALTDLVARACERAPVGLAIEVGAEKMVVELTGSEGR